MPRVRPDLPAREEGYFLGAMYVSYLLASVFLVPFYFLIVTLFPGWNSTVAAVVAMLPYLPLTPAVFRYSRVVWIYLDRAADATGINAGLYEKLRLDSDEDPADRGYTQETTPEALSSSDALRIQSPAWTGPPSAN